MSVQMKIIQGAVVVNEAEIVYESPTVVLLEIDTATKRVDIAGTTGGSSPGVLLVTTEGSLKEHPDLEGWTDIEFPEYEGWRVFSCMGGKYTVRVTLLNPLDM